LDFVVANVGRGPAKNVSYKIVSGGDDLKSKGVRLLSADVKFAYLLAGHQLSWSMGMGFNLLANPRLEPFEVEVSYENLRGDVTTARHMIDVSQFDGMGRLGQEPEELIAEHLKKIAGVMESWNHRRLQVETMSVTERAEHDTELMKRMEEQRAKRGGASPEQS
jgi:hypothetical protein